MEKVNIVKELANMKKETYWRQYCHFNDLIPGGKIGDLIKALERYDSEEYRIECGDDDWGGREYYIMQSHIETDKEFEKRQRRLEIDLERHNALVEKQKAKQEAQDRKEYERLKKKFDAKSKC
jgi:hypothetical protein